MKHFITSLLLLFNISVFAQLPAWAFSTEDINISVWQNSWGNYTYSLQIGEVSTSDRTQNIIAKSAVKTDLYYPAVRYMVYQYPIIVHEEEIYHVDPELFEITTGDGDHYVFREYRDLIWFLVHEFYPETQKELECPPIDGVFQLKPKSK